MVIHHLICDGWSSNLLANQLASYVCQAGKIADAESSSFTYTRFIDEEKIIVKAAVLGVMQLAGIPLRKNTPSYHM